MFYYILLFSLATIVGTNYIIKKIFNNTIIYDRKSYSTTTNLINMKVDSSILSPDNHIYETSVKSDTKLAGLYHLINGLINYFSDKINSYFLIICVGKIIYDGKIGIAFSLGAFCLYAMIQNYNQLNPKSIKQRLTNMEIITRNEVKYGQLPDGQKILVYGDKIIEQKNLKRGHFIRLTENDNIPADILLLSFDPLNKNNRVITEECSLTGEAIALCKSNLYIHPNDIKQTKITINHFKANGCLTIGDKSISYTEQNVIFRGTKILDGEVFGLIIETGNDCKIKRINYSHKKKITNIQKIMDNASFINLIIMLCISTLTTYYMSYMQEIDNIETFLINNFRLILLYNTIVPLSWQPIFYLIMNAIAHRIVKKYLSSHDITINATGTTSLKVHDLICTDKTGTLTTGKMALGAIYIKNSHGQVINALEQPSQDVLTNILACTESQAHSRTGLILETNPEEALLLQHFLQKYGYKLISNQINGPVSAGSIRFNRYYYKPYNPTLQFKYSVISEDEKEFILHVQGTPEIINKLSNGHLQSLIDQTDMMTLPNNIFPRTIAHGAKSITKDELEILEKDPMKIINHLTYVSLYMFHDYLKDDVANSLDNFILKGTKISILTGDQQSTSIRIATGVGLINPATQLLIIDKLEDIYQNQSSVANSCQIINGRLIEEIVNSNEISHLYRLIKEGQKYIIYRATPKGKADYIAFLKKWFNKKVTMIGDGLNDLSAFNEADQSISIKHATNTYIQEASDIAIHQWPSLNLIAEEGEIAMNTMDIISRMVTYRHVMTFVYLYIHTLMTNFDNLIDPIDQLLNIALNIIFTIMIYYFSVINQHIKVVKPFNYHIFKAIIHSIICYFISKMLFNLIKWINITTPNHINLNLFELELAVINIDVAMFIVLQICCVFYEIFFTYN